MTAESHPNEMKERDDDMASTAAEGSCGTRECTDLNPSKVHGLSVNPFQHYYITHYMPLKVLNLGVWDCGAGIYCGCLNAGSLIRSHYSEL
jgi:hypothetical protein